MITLIKKSLREYKTASILSIVFILCEVVMECLLPFITSKLVDQMNDSNNKLLAIYSIVLILMAMLSLTFGALAGRYSAKAAAGFAKNLRKDMYEAISNYSFENIDKFQASSLVTRMTTDVTNVQNAYIQIIRGAIRSPFMIIFSLIMSFYICANLAKYFVLVMVILAILLFGIMAIAMHIFRRLFKKYDALNDSVEENIKGIRVVKSFTREDYEKNKFNKASDNLKKDFTLAERIIGFASPIMQGSVNVIMVLIIFLGATIIVKNSSWDGVSPINDPKFIYNDLTLGQFQSLMTYGFQSLMALMMLQMVIIMIAMSVESSKRIKEVLEEKSKLTNPDNPIYEVEDGSVEFRNVSFKYSQTAHLNALSDINFKIESGQTVGIIGGTGSSKTTLVNLISRLYDTTDGEVIVAGHDVKEYDIKSLRDNVSVVLQKNQLFAGSIKENLKWGNENATDEEIIEASKLACADEFVQSFPEKYDTYITQGGTNVSGGQKQRLCIARALLKKPKILILDDSTSAVDTKTDAIIRKGFKEFIPSTTKIIIAQRISSIQDSDLIIVMDNGRINAIGTHDELLANNEIYQEVYYTQNKKESE
ncbi:MAG: ABC transporter ATP-binding protein/permease [Acholeplasmatales bacterium]|nr:ABC transporter ATP-binding protein/permease [Acholeplasmatales bacterium]